VFDTRAVGGESLAERVRPGVEPSDARARLALVAERTRPVVLARTRLLPVLPPFAPLLPDGGLPRGITVTVGGPGATSVALAMAAAPTAEGSWAALVGLPNAGLAAAAELGVALERIAVIDAPEPDQWASVVAALLGAFDLVLVAPGHRVAAGAVRRLAARARERGTVLMPVTGPAGRLASGGWPEAPELRLGAVASRWEGLHDGHGHLRSRRLTVEATGRRGLSRPRRVELLLPGPNGGVEAVPVHEGARPGEGDPPEGAGLPRAGIGLRSAG
jgi:hypothetical protein